MNKVIKDFLNSNDNRIIITNHVSGYRVSLCNFEYGEVVSEVIRLSPNFWENHDSLHSISKCVEKFEERLKIKENEKLEELKIKKKKLKEELQEVSEQINSKTLKLFKNDLKNTEAKSYINV
jgi:hypothetical protein